MRPVSGTAVSMRVGAGHNLDDYFETLVNQSSSRESISRSLCLEMLLNAQAI